MTHGLHEHLMVMLAVARISASSGRGQSSVKTLRNLYGATTGAFAVILALAIWLAHGIAR